MKRTYPNLWFTYKHSAISSIQFSVVSITHTLPGGTSFLCVARERNLAIWMLGYTLFIERLSIMDPRYKMLCFKYKANALKSWGTP